MLGSVARCSKTESFGVEFVDFVDGKVFGSEFGSSEAVDFEAVDFEAVDLEAADFEHGCFEFGWFEFGDFEFVDFGLESVRLGVLSCFGSGDFEFGCFVTVNSSKSAPGTGFVGYCCTLK